MKQCFMTYFANRQTNEHMLSNACTDASKNNIAAGSKYVSSTKLREVECVFVHVVEMTKRLQMNFPTIKPRQSWAGT